VSHLPKHDFWDFSLRLYSSDGVPEVCLRLQDALGLDVNIAFFCLWWSNPEAALLDQERFDAIVRPAIEWHNAVVLPTRAARKAVKAELTRLSGDESTGVYRKLLEIEIETEHAEQIILARSAEEQTRTRPRGSEVSSHRAARNIALYRRHLTGGLTAKDCEDLGTLLSIGCRTTQDVALSQLAEWGLCPSRRVEDSQLHT